MTYNTVSVPSWYFYTLKNDCHNKSSYHLSPYKIITIFIDYKIVIILFIDSCCIVHPSDIYFVTGSLYFFNSCTCFTHPLHPLPLMITSFFLYLWIYFCFVMFVHLFWFLCVYWWMNEEGMIYTHNGMLLIYKKEWNLAICDNMHDPRGCYTK